MAPTKRKSKAVGHDQFLSVSCPSRSECIATSNKGGEVTFNPSTATITRHATLDAGHALTGVRCRGTQQCTAVDDVGNAITFNPLSSSRSSSQVALEPLNAVSCPANNRCTAVDNVGDEVTFNVTGPADQQQVDIDLGRNLTAVACPSGSQCTAVDANGMVVTFNPGTGSVNAGPTSLGQGNPLSGISCPTIGLCMAIDKAAHELLFNPGVPSSGVRTIPGAHTLQAVFCSSVAECVAVDNTGNGFVGLTPPVPKNRPFISGRAVLGGTLSEHHAKWYGVPTRYTYSWQRCGRSGANCSIIPGARGQQYHLTSADVGHRIRVLETAYNKVSQSVPVNSFPTKTVKS